MPIKRSYADHGDACATAHAMDLLGDHWTYPVLRELMFGPKRFVELQDGVRGITPAVLTARLRELETSGLVHRSVLAPPARAAVYDLTDWARELRPLFEGLAHWALRSPVRVLDGCGLTPDAIAQSMLAMAPPTALEPPVVLGLHLRDARVPGAATYPFRLAWGEHLDITRAEPTDAAATVRGDSSTWTEILYAGRTLDDVEVTGDEAAVRRVVAQFAGVAPAA